MGCCRKDNKKSTNKYDSSIRTKESKIRKKKNSIENKNERNIAINGIDQNQILDDVNNLKQPRTKLVDEKESNPNAWDNGHEIKSVTISSSKPLVDDVKNDISSFDNTFTVTTLYDLQQSITHNEKPIAIIFFHADYCPYSKRMISSLRHWAQSNKDRIVLYEADVEKAPKLVECYHIRAIPTLIALNKSDLLTPVWRRTANDVLPSNLEMSLYSHEEVDNNQFRELFRQKLDKSNNKFLIFDSTMYQVNHRLKAIDTQNDNNQEQYLIVLETRKSKTDESKLILAITSEINETELLKILSQSDLKHYESSKPLVISKDIASVSSRSMQDLDNYDEYSSKPVCVDGTNEYNGRIISKSSIDTSFARKDLWNESVVKTLNSNYQFPIDKSQQRILLSNSNEIFYEKQYKRANEPNDSSSFDRFSTLTYQHVKDTNDSVSVYREEICVLYFGPNRCRGFEDNIHRETASSKLSLLTLKSNSIME